jgi:hypothetical protein
MKLKVTEAELINLWLEKYHGIRYEDIYEVHPEWEETPRKHSQDFYRTYPVTEAQHDEWHEAVIDLICKRTRRGKKFVRGAFTWTYLNVAPSIKKEEEL